MKFCVIASPRTGSTWFMDLLNKQRGVKAFGEVFLEGLETSNEAEVAVAIQPRETYHEYVSNHGRSQRLSVPGYLSDLESQAGNCSAVGFKVMYHQLRWNRLLGPTMILRRYRAIHLVRRNEIEAYLSYQLSATRGVWHTGASQNPERITVDVNHMLAHLKKRAVERSTFETLLSLTRPGSIKVAYEDLVANTETEVGRVMDYLGQEFDSSLVESKFRRTNPGSAKDKIINYDEVLVALDNESYKNQLRNL